MPEFESEFEPRETRTSIPSVYYAAIERAFELAELEAKKRKTFEDLTDPATDQFGWPAYWGKGSSDDDNGGSSEEPEPDPVPTLERV